MKLNSQLLNASRQGPHYFVMQLISFLMILNVRKFYTDPNLSPLIDPLCVINGNTCKCTSLSAFLTFTNSELIIMLLPNLL